MLLSEIYKIMNIFAAKICLAQACSIFSRKFYWNNSEIEWHCSLNNDMYLRGAKLEKQFSIAKHFQRRVKYLSHLFHRSRSKAQAALTPALAFFWHIEFVQRWRSLWSYQSRSSYMSHWSIREDACGLRKIASTRGQIFVRTEKHSCNQRPGLTSSTWWVGLMLTSPVLL